MKNEYLYIIGGLVVIYLIANSQGWMGSMYPTVFTHAEASTYVDQAYPTSNYGTSLNMKISNTQHTYIKFKYKLPEGKIIDSASLCFFTDIINIPGSINLYNTPSDWTYSIKVNNVSASENIDWNHRFVLEKSFASFQITEGLVCEDITNWLKTKSSGDISIAMQSNTAEIVIKGALVQEDPFLRIDYANYVPPTPECGDGTVNAEGEQCDDGNAISKDGCANCLLECKIWETAKKDGSWKCSFNPIIAIVGGIILLIIFKNKKVLSHG